MKYLTGAIIAIVLFISGLLTGRFYYAKTEIKVVEKEVTKTEYKYKYLKTESKPKFTEDNFTRLLYCYNTNLVLDTNTKDNTLYVKCYDECKEITGQYKISAKDYKHFFQAAAIYQYNLDYSLEISYIYNFSFIGIGAGIIINKSNPGIKVILQKGFY